LCAVDIERWKKAGNERRRHLRMASTSAAPLSQAAHQVIHAESRRANAVPRLVTVIWPIAKRGRAGPPDLIRPSR
jgi:hypothetical protein